MLLHHWHMFQRILVMFAFLIVIAGLWFSANAAADEIQRFPVQPTERQYQEAVQQLEAIGFRPSREARTLFVSKPDVTDTQLAMVPNLPFSFGLALAAVPVTDAGVKSLSSLDNLTTLNLNYTQFTGEKSCGFENLTSLLELRLLGSPVTDQGLLEVAKLKNLRLLDLQKTKVKGPGLEQLSSLAKLSTLELDLTDAMFPPLRAGGLLHKLPYAEGANGTTAHRDDDIQVLNLNGFYGLQISAVSIPVFATLPQLQTLTLIGSDISDDGLIELSQYPELRTLNLEQTKVTDRGLKHLAAIKNLTELTLDQTAVTDFNDFLQDVVANHVRDESPEDEGESDLPEGTIPLTAVPLREIAILYPVAQIATLLKSARKVTGGDKGATQEVPTFLDFNNRRSC